MNTSSNDSTVSPLSSSDSQVSPLLLPALSSTEETQDQQEMEEIERFKQQLEELQAMDRMLKLQQAEILATIQRRTEQIRKNRAEEDARRREEDARRKAEDDRLEALKSTLRSIDAAQEALRLLEESSEKEEKQQEQQEQQKQEEEPKKGNYSSLLPYLKGRTPASSSTSSSSPPPQKEEEAPLRLEVIRPPTGPREPKNSECPYCKAPAEDHWDINYCPKIRCTNCQMVGHTRHVCTNSKREWCKRCRQIGHLEKDCKADAPCDYCKKRDHTTSEHRLCAICGDPYHHAKYCTSKAEQDQEEYEETSGDEWETEVQPCSICGSVRHQDEGHPVCRFCEGKHPLHSCPKSSCKYCRRTGHSQEICEDRKRAAERRGRLW